MTCGTLATSLRFVRDIAFILLGNPHDLNSFLLDSSKQRMLSALPGKKSAMSSIALAATHATFIDKAEWNEVRPKIFEHK